MKFITNTIKTATKGKKSFADLIKEATTSNNNIKTASAEAVLEKEAGDCLTPGQEKLPDFLKEKIMKSKGCSEDAPKDDAPKEKKEEKKEAGAATAETEIKTASEENKEKYEDERRTDVHHMEGTKDQQSKGCNGEPEDNGAKTNTESKSEAKKEAKTVTPETKKEAKTTIPPKDIKADAKSTVKATVPAKTAEKAEDVKKRTDVHHMEGTKDQESKGTNGEPDKDGEKKAVQNTSKGFVRLSNLTPKQKKFVWNFYRMFWPTEFADALVADR